jgi:hypothetical protein
MLDEGRRILPLAMLDADLAQRSITLMAPSKTYNIPGLGCAFAVIPDAALRRALPAPCAASSARQCARSGGLPRPLTRLRRLACGLLGVLRGNRDRVERRCRDAGPRHEPCRSDLSGVDRRARPRRRRSRRLSSKRPASGFPMAPISVCRAGCRLNFFAVVIVLCSRLLVEPRRCPVSKTFRHFLQLTI